MEHPAVAAEAAPTRRAVLGGSLALAAGLLASCTSPPDPAPTAPPTTQPDADDQVRAEVAAAEASIIDLYDAVIAGYPMLASDLSPLRDEHVAHAEAVGQPSAQGSAGPADAFASAGDAISALIDAERRAIAQRTAACETATGVDLARTLALIAASEAGHAEYLRGIA